MEFLRRFTIEAYSEKGAGLRRPVSNWTGALEQELLDEFRGTSEWQSFEDTLLALAEWQLNPPENASPQQAGSTVEPGSILSGESWGTPVAELQSDYLPRRHRFIGGPSDPAKRTEAHEEFCLLARELQAAEGPGILSPLEASDRLIDRLTRQEFGEWHVGELSKKARDLMRRLRLQALEQSRPALAATYQRLFDGFSGLTENNAVAVDSSDVPGDPIGSADSAVFSVEQTAEDGLPTAPSNDTRFPTEAGRKEALADYLAHWSENGYPNCSEASLARAALVHPSDLSKWKQCKLVPDSDKARRIERVIFNNKPPCPVPNRRRDD